MKKNTITVVVLSAIISLTLRCSAPPQPGAFIPQGLGAAGVAFHGKTFTCVNVVDGDTIDIALHPADPNLTRIRLLGVDTPETKHPRMPVQYFGPESSRYVTSVCLNRTVIIALDPVSDIRGYYGRLLAYIQLDDGSILQERLLTLGFAYADTRFPYSHKAHYIELERMARTSGTGLWQHVTFDQLPPWIRRTNPDILSDRLSE